MSAWLITTLAIYVVIALIGARRFRVEHPGERWTATIAICFVLWPLVIAAVLVITGLVIARIIRAPAWLRG